MFYLLKKKSITLDIKLYYYSLQKGRLHYLIMNDVDSHVVRVNESKCLHGLGGCVDTCIFDGFNSMRVCLYVCMNDS